MAFVILLASSCGNVKNLQYVQGSFDTARLSKVQFTDPVIQTGDLLGITLFSDDASATAAVSGQPIALDIDAKSTKPELFNDNPAKSSTGYLVSHDGFIQLYKIGRIQAAGMSKRQLADTLAGRYVALDLLKNPYVEVRFLNYKVTLVGEVSRPGVYSFPTEKISIFDAIGLAGDITVYGKRDNVMVVREVNGVRQFAQLDLSKPEVFASPYYYLQQNDMVIVDVTKKKAALNDQATVRNITIATSILATIAIFINIFN
ncbi:polysaccharide biosynthesis/export family protein [Paraflavitalea sp. CAU 1676]|uniref:polysaccharide biosynthesis/export family protein n=1 Tax=Paraflavitalea sp. CAU 1676 TaxID=3032598 RepID=UPI0023DA2D88|nr:polysaccharide biosynthesis/export family protein [Paraflavitalea sp. CAU 1676]MDF2187051.1 polysaccharide biosynthesis/export family protein [Paraflavitalea sp. CAU 1676]